MDISSCIPYVLCLGINLVTAWGAEDNNDIFGSVVWLVTWGGCIWTLEMAYIGLGIDANSTIGGYYIIGSLVGQLLLMPIRMKMNESKRQHKRDELFEARYREYL